MPAMRPAQLSASPAMIHASPSSRLLRHQEVIPKVRLFKVGQSPAQIRTLNLELGQHQGSFAGLTKRRLKRRVFKGVVDLQTAINRFVVDHNQKPRPFIWTADPDKIIAAASRVHQVLASSTRSPLSGGTLMAMFDPKRTFCTLSFSR